MAIPHKLKDFNVFGDGEMWLGMFTEVTIPKLEREMKDYRANGMNGPVSIDLGNKKLEISLKAGGYVWATISKYAVPTADGIMLRLAGSIQSDETGEEIGMEIIVRGRFGEVDFGKMKSGDDTETEFKMPLTYIKISLQGKTFLEMDFIHYIEIVNGVDRLAQRRKNIGL